MRTCLKCGDHFPIMAKIGGKKKNLGSRKYCLKCSPFASHNTSRLHEERNDEGCPTCGSTTNKSRKGRRICWSCENKREEEFAADKLHAVVGEKCWLCDYGRDKTTRCALDFHHLYDKKFSLTKRIVSRTAWIQVLEEAKKCVLICCRCHREFHGGLIEEEHIKQIWKNRWDQIEQAARKTANPTA